MHQPRRDLTLVAAARSERRRCLPPGMRRSDQISDGTPLQFSIFISAFSIFNAQG